MFKVNSSQFNYLYGDQIHFPYSISCLISYLKKFENINKNFEFCKTFVFRDDVDEYVKQCKNSNILLCSCYVWNWESTKYLAKEVKKINPECLTIFGGPQIPNQIDNFFKEHYYIDICVHGEGELIIKNIFNRFLEINSNITSITFEDIKGISTFHYNNSREERISDLSILTSPYLTNEVWNLVDKNNNVKWIASWETNRGCPYQCSFCDWGSSIYSKIREYPIERLENEIKWFADNQIIYIDCCDANFGILPRDIKITEKLKQVSLSKKYPKTFRQSWAKMSSEKIIPIAKNLMDAKLLTAVGLSVESLDEKTLNIIKRKNIKFDKFSNLTSEFKKNNIPTYTEIIRGLPGETLESFKNNLEIISSETKIDSMYIYNCSLLPNSPMNDLEYLRKYKIKTIRSPIYLAHSYFKNRGMNEYENIVVSTFSFNLKDIKKMFIYSWIMLTFQNLGILEYISRFFYNQHNIKYMQFYDMLIEYCKDSNNMFSKEFGILLKYIDEGYYGNGWNHYDNKLGDIYWNLEEASWLRLTENPTKLKYEIWCFILYLINKLNLKKTEVFLDLLNFQIFMLSTKVSSLVVEKTLFSKYDWKDFFLSNKIVKNNVSYVLKNKIIYDGNSFEWNKNIIWYGRRSNKFKFNISELKDKIL